ncbi:MAG TPA: zinc-ribbon domain-containing protein, partial [Ramlibacter sp.]
MSLITSCPACGTMFRVVPDQLKISEGWVRCGHCSEVFDATAHLTDESVLVEPELAQRASRPADLPARPTEMPTRPTEMPTRPAELPTRPSDLAPRPPPLPARPAATSSESIEPSDFF